MYHLETKLGGIKEFDPFIKYYFNKFKYQSLNTAQFVDTLYEFYEPKGKAEILDNIDWETWLFVSGLPEKPEFDVTLANQVYALVDKWVTYVKMEVNFQVTKLPILKVSKTCCFGNLDRKIQDS